MKVTLVAHTPNPLYVCAEAASVCYDSEPSLKIVKGCIRSGHTSVLEHASFTFKIEGISRSCSHQLVRHRMASYSQQSQRYVKYDELDWVIPDYGIDGDFARQTCDIALNAYKYMTDDANPGFQKSTIDAARCVLPNATPTVIYVTMNIRALMNFFNERLCTRASKEIREVATLMKKVIIEADTIDREEALIFDKIFVPKCYRTEPHICPESPRTSCGRCKTLNQIIDELNELRAYKAATVDDGK